MRQVALWCVLAGVLAVAAPASAQQGPPPPIRGIVVDLRGTLPQFPNDQQLADSRGLTQLELPGDGLGLDVGAHVYLFRWKAMTLGAGGQLTLGRSNQSAATSSDGSTTRAVNGRFTSISPQVSFNFGSGNGWSYLSGGVGPTTWSIVPEGSDPLPEDDEKLQTFNYGGGARWMLRRHLAFTFDVRFYQVNPGTPHGVRPSSPRMTFIILGAGISLK